ncbi:hypothetical protein [Enteractinococcus helveticum]|uniref:Uncharacterized protein n=1 Tax=Enteractinococcus helveticum TaxID=1837282 RepID=A0A1B7LYV5_9MICC|nr:hypothetical protein [Enteractinococcus helveticum]OAV60578.1 hypothetical protein A6F49_11540 [Enteractinococcus helveticum]
MANNESIEPDLSHYSFRAFFLLAFVGPVFISEPDHVGWIVLVSVAAFVIFFGLANLHLRPKYYVSGWIILIVFVLGYVVLFFLRGSDIRPDSHWFFISPLGYIFAALVIKPPDKMEQKASLRSLSGGYELQCWSSKSQISPPTGDFRELVRRLDGVKLTLVRVTRKTHCLEIAGGAEGRCVLYYSADFRDDNTWFVYTGTVSETEPGDKEQLMFLGDIKGYIRENLWCYADEAQQVVEDFLRHGSIDTGTNSRWINRGPMAGGLRPSLPVITSDT